MGKFWIISLLLALASTVSGPSSSAQDLETRVRQQQEEVRRKIEEGRARIHQSQQEMQARTSALRTGSSSTNQGQYPQNYGSFGVTSPSPDLSRNRGYPTMPSHRMAAPSPSASEINGSQNVWVPPAYSSLSSQGSPPSKYKAASGSATGETKNAGSEENPHRHHHKKHTADDTASYENFDQMKETGPPPSSGGIVWQGFWKGAFVGGLTGGAIALLFILPLQLLRLRGIDPSKYTAAAILAAIVASGASVSRNSSNTYDQWAKTFPFLGTLLPASQSDLPSGPLHFANYKSDGFQFAIALPQPIYLDRKIVQNLWTTTAVHQQQEGAFSISYLKIPPPAELAKAVNPIMASMPSNGPITFDVQKGLDGAAKSSVEYIHGETTNQSQIGLNPDCPGREVEGKLPNGDGLFRQRIYIFNSNMYQLIVVGKPEWVNSSDAYKFLDSFKLLESGS